MADVTTVSVSTDTKDALEQYMINEYGTSRVPYDDVISGLLDRAEEE